jgi:hypothetical protein
MQERMRLRDVERGLLAPDLAIRDSRNPAEKQVACDWPANELLSCRRSNKGPGRTRLPGRPHGR